KRTIYGLIVLSMATILAVFSKEDGLLLPFLALAVELLLYRGRGTAGAARLIRYYFGALCLLTAGAMLLTLIVSPHMLIGNYAFRNFTLGQRLLSEPRILFDYLSMLLFPMPGSMGFFHDDFVLSTGLLHPLTTLWSLLGLVALAVSAWFARKRLPLYALGVAIFLIGQSMESSFIALEPMFEHRNYLPSFGVFLGITDLVAWLLTNRHQLLRTTLAGLVLLSLTILLAVRVMHWSSSLNLYTAAVNAHPDSDGAISSLAQVYLDAGKPELALQALATHTSFGARLQRAYIECKMDGSLTDSRLESLAQQPMKYLDSYPVTGLTMLGALGIQGQCRFPDTAYSRLIDEAARLNTTGHGLRYMLYIYSGYYHQRLQQLAQATAAMQAAHLMSPDIPVPLILSAGWYLKAGDLVQAAAQLQQARDIDRRYHTGFTTDIAQLQAQIESAGSSSKSKPR
ncbi:MAG: hypothetical protein ACRESC_06620, partial [Gammaproteobacteria bacterium]